MSSAAPRSTDRSTDRGTERSTDRGTDRGRDRDEAGRARNARPRDGLGRPLGRGDTGEPTLPDGVVLAPADALETAQQMLDAGRPFHAHEVLEASWKAAPPAERDLWQGLAQLAVGLTHARRGNASGAAALLRRGAERVGRYATDSPRQADVHGVDTSGLPAKATALADQIETAGLGPLIQDQLTLRLRVSQTSQPARHTSQPARHTS